MHGGSRTSSPAGRIRRNGIRRGLVGGEPLWQLVFLVSQLAVWVRRAAKRGEKPIRFSHRLQPGEGFSIRHLGAEPGRPPS